MLRLANQVRRKKAFDNKWFLYEFIDKNPGLTNYNLSKQLDWTSGKVKWYTQKLVEDGMIHNSTEIVNGKVQKRFYGKTVREFLDEIESNKK